ncbi:MAG TPA: hypothetical protein VKV40_24640 [Ktedonobacteraceae bacterium]|nr:hypothetical protein [Ktedonobacteraceae bacterium]
MHDTQSSIHVINFLGLIGLFGLWIILFEGTHLLLSLLRNEPLIGWAVGPFGFTPLYLREPSTFFILLNVFLPALVSGLVLYIGLFTSIAPITLPHDILLEIIVIAAGILITSTGDGINALRDLRYPLWGEARILRNIQSLRASWATIHFTPFGSSYLREQFGSSPTDLLRLL